MGIQKTNSLGKITVSDEVMANIAGITAIGCYGIVGMTSKKATDGIIELLGKENLSRGVKIHSQDDSVIIDLFIVVEYGISIATVAKNVIETVKYNIENLTGVTVKKVNVNVEGVRV